MRSMEEIYRELNALITEGGWEKIEPFLCGCMEEAKEGEAHGSYIAVGNELLSFYRETEQFDKAFHLAEDLLLLMEEFNLEDTEHFALVLINAAAAYGGAGRDEEAAAFYERATRILEGKKGTESLLARVLTERALLLIKKEADEEAERLFASAAGLFESVAEEEVPEEERKRRKLYYVTALTGLGETAYRGGRLSEALDFYQRAARESGDQAAAKVLLENCALLEKLLREGNGGKGKDTP